MKIYHTETQEDYDALMVELEEQGCKWSFGIKSFGIKSFGIKLSEVNSWHMNEHLTCLRVYDSKVNHASLNYYKEDYPNIPIIKYKAKVDDKMKFTKENVLNLTDKWIENKTVSFQDLQNQIKELDDTPEKVVVPKFVADFFRSKKKNSLAFLFKEFATADDKEVRFWYFSQSGRFKSPSANAEDTIAKMYLYGYTIEPDTATEQRYTVVVADRYLVQLFMGRTDYMFVEFDELWTWEPDAFQLTEAEIKAIDERYIPFMIPVDEVKL